MISAKKVSSISDLILNPDSTIENILYGLAIDVILADYIVALNEFSGLIPKNLTDSINFPISNNKLTLNQHSNGGFFTNDNSPSVWLTAFAVRTLNRMKTYVTINSTIINKANEFLTNNQNVDGTFNEPGTISDKYLQGGTGSGLAFNIFIALALIETNQVTYQAQYTKTINYLLTKSINGTDPYTLTMFAYTLQLLKHAQRSTYTNRVIGSAKKVPGYVWWEVDGVSGDPSNKTTSNLNIEATAYACLVMVLSNQVSNAQFVGTWLLQKVNVSTATENTQSFVMGLEAINKLTILAGNSIVPKLTVNVSSWDESKLFTLNQTNVNETQEIDVSNNFLILLFFSSLFEKNI